MKKIGLLDVKRALNDGRFRDSLPPEFHKRYEKEIVKFLSDPGCSCNVPLYRGLLRDCRTQLEAYFPGREAMNEQEEAKKLAENNWTVINCKADELEERLRRLPNGRKQLAIARYEDLVTVVINEIDVVY